MRPGKRIAPKAGSNGVAHPTPWARVPASGAKAPPSDWTFEGRLDTDTEWALTEGSHFLDGRGRVHEALRKIASRLNDLGVPYAVVGGMAMFRHGYQRFTEDVDILVTPDGLKTIHERLDGRGYIPPFAGSKHLRDADLRVKIEFLLTGGFPGDGKPKPVAFPDPANVGVEHNGVRYITIEGLIEMKLASGMSNPDRMKDITDVYEIIKALRLGPDVAARLNPYVRAKFIELFETAARYGTSASPDREDAH
jgi:hypothetical protein